MGSKTRTTGSGKRLIRVGTGGGGWASSSSSLGGIVGRGLLREFAQLMRSNERLVPTKPVHV